MIRRKLPLILLSISLIFGLIAMPKSAAITINNLSRNATSVVSADSNAVVKLEGFNSSQYTKLNSNYSKVGSITNNSNQVMNINVIMTPSQVFSIFKTYQLGVKIGSSSCVFRNNTASTQQLAVSLMPGQSIDVQMSLTNNLLDFISTSFTINAYDNTKTYSLSIQDTSSSPRRILTY